jgi:DNA-binding MurR/RpiR family transcriptional regulator
MNALVRLKEHLPFLNPAEHAAADFILQNPRTAVSLSIHELAKRAYVSPSAVVRMCHAIGLSGYREFIRELIGEVALDDADLSRARDEIRKEDSIPDIIHKITAINIQSLNETERMMDPKVLKKCVDLMDKAERIIFLGLGASWLAARDGYEKLLRINKPCILNEDWHLQLLSSRNSTKKDLGIVISYSGQTVEIIECLKAMKENRTPVIAITRSVKSPISELADIRLYTTTNESLFRSAAMSSRISQLNIIDILYTAFANRDYENSIAQLRKTHIRKPGQK